MSNSFNPIDCSPLSSSVHGILQARTLEWVAISLSRGSSRPRGWTWVSCTAVRFFTVWTTRETQPLHSPGKYSPVQVLQESGRGQLTGRRDAVSSSPGFSAIADALWQVKETSPGPARAVLPKGISYQSEPTAKTQLGDVFHNLTNIFKSIPFFQLI